MLVIYFSVHIHHGFIDVRTFTWSLTAGALGLLAGEDNVARAARRPPSPPPQEKTDPNVSGLQAKVLASKKRKEAMKEAMAKLRERGKPINEAPAQPPPTEPSE